MIHLSKSHAGRGTVKAWKNDKIPNSDFGAILRQQPKLPVQPHGEGRQFGLLPLDGA